MVLHSLSQNRCRMFILAGSVVSKASDLERPAICPAGAGQSLFGKGNDLGRIIKSARSQYTGVSDQDTAPLLVAQVVALAHAPAKLAVAFVVAHLQAQIGVLEPK